jgi:hypothetical protein
MFAGIDVASQRHVLARLDAQGMALGPPTPITEDQAGYAKLVELLAPPPTLGIGSSAGVRSQVSNGSQLVDQRGIGALAQSR